jgi:hypothetical protein
MLKNYTSSVSAGQSIRHIEDVLAAHGASQILKEYERDGLVTAVAFIVPMRGVDVPFKLPARVGQCEKVLRGQIKRPREDTEKKIAEQALRTAWKIVSDWVDAQMAMVDLSQVELMEVFLPYVYDGVRKQTYFERIKERGFKTLLPAGSQEESR